MKWIFIVAALLIGVQSPAFALTPGEVVIGGNLRDVPMNGLNSSTGKFSAYRGKPLVINVWASWCGPCREEMGSLEKLHQRLGKTKINVIGISTDDYRNAALGFLGFAKVSFPNYIDHDVILENMLGANKIPLTILVDADGRILQKIYGTRDWDSPSSLSLISQTYKLKLQ